MNAPENALKRRLGGREATTAQIKGAYAISVGNPETPLPNGWSWRLLTDLARLESGHTPSRKKPEYWGGAIPWVGIRDATCNHGNTIYSTNENTNELGIANSAARILPKDTVCLSRTASVGYVVVMGTPMATSQDFVNWTCNEQLDYRFLKYALIAEGDTLLKFASGSVHQTIYFPEVKSFYLALPPIGQQNAIAEILSALDSKIEVNRQINKTLEKTAATIFKDWFVDFGPTRAKIEGRAPYLAPDIWALFPDRQNDEGRPEGWDEIKIENLLELAYGKSLPAADRRDGAVPVYGSGGLTGFHNQSLVEAPAIIVGRKGTVGSLYWEHRPCYPIDTVFYVRSRFPLSYCYNLLQMLGLADMNTDAAVPGLNRSNVYRLLVPNAPAPLIKTFGEQADAFRAKVVANLIENETLAATRDLLLPKLMSGKIHLAEAKNILEDVS